MSRIIAAAARSDTLAGPGTEKVLLELEEEEARALESLAGQIEQLLLSTDPGDETVSRLFPVAYTDAVEAADFARFTRPSLHERKVNAALEVRLAIEAGNELDESSSRLSVEIGPDELWNWLTFLTDLRLVLVDSIGLDESGQVRDVDGPTLVATHEEQLSEPPTEQLTWPEADVFEAHEREAAELLTLQRGVYDWAAFLQDSLVAAAEHGEASEA